MAKPLDLRKKKKDVSSRRHVEQAQSVQTDITSGKADVAAGRPRIILPLASLRWSGPQYYQFTDQRGALFGASILVGIGVALYFFGGNFISLLLLLMLAVMLVVYVRRKPPIVEFEIVATHIRVGDRVYQMGDIRSFWITVLDDYSVSVMSLQLKKWYTQYVKIPLQSQDPVQVREILLQFIPEEEHKENFADELGRFFGV